MSTDDSARVDIGHPVITVAAKAALEAAGISPVLLLARHVRGDWGDLEPEDRLQNELGLLLGKRLLSSYVLPGQEKVWIITEADRSVTTVMLPSDY
jgi:hypothetical protein